MYKNYTSIMMVRVRLVLKFEFLKFRILEILYFHPCTYVHACGQLEGMMLLHLHVNIKKLKPASLAIETGYKILKSIDPDQLTSFMRSQQFCVYNRI